MVKPIQQFMQHMPKRHQMIIAGVSVLLLLLLVWPSEKASASRDMAQLEQLEPGVRYELALKLGDSYAPADTEANYTWVDYEVRSGDNMAVIFQRLGFSARQLYDLTQAEDANILRRIHPGDTLRFAKDTDNNLIALHYRLSETDTLIIEKNQNGEYQTNREAKPTDIRIAFARAEITSNFWNAGVQAGLSQGQIMSLAELFGWDVDFALDIRQGDEFSVLFEEKYIDGQYVGTGQIVAAEFINQGEVFRAILHENGSYYTDTGRSMRKTFLRAPVAFNRVSSEFNPRRLHPVTGRVAPHRGIDYAAPTGTPVMSSGDGRVIASAYNNLNGHYIFVQHGERYVTKYLHLSRRQVNVGDRVSQGQVIGRVGATGRVTGAHLHYEFLVDGVHRNPRTVNLPKAESLPESEMAVFQAIAQEQLAMIEGRKRFYLAMVD
ncbi:peptidase M23 [Aliidiomarina iranensis]|uniref:Peptidase M23 n=1 Tax=Aliidiomarina iranensis TaxID=1434071 RepID=A0A432VV25_9GAMM|nr:peptidoglycan DD-metalloendopeptidase family protein [Aliidiomarina iranensis]RUO20386.1 peptidase M23 [Aliidiomarina iranensis]